jgi:hypothetical protein
MNRMTQVPKVTQPTQLAHPPSVRSDQQSRIQRAEERLIARVFERCHAVIAQVCARSSVPAEFLGALTANESGGNAHAARFEPSVYRHLNAVADGARHAYGGIRAQDLSAEVDESLHPKEGAYHGRFLTAPFGSNHAQSFAASDDEVLRELATSWGYTQIMGYHMIGRAGTVHDLLDPEFHFRIALELLAEFTDDYQLDLAHESEETFRCWNTGQPYGATFDPHYVENGLRRMELYRAFATQHRTPPQGGAANS